MNIIDQRFERLRVLEYSHTRRTPSGQCKKVFRCACDCGAEVQVTYGHLTSGHTRSCGCLLREVMARPRVAQRVGDHPLWRIYQGMRTRCENPKSQHYAEYGGRGISVCDRWREGFWNFADDMGERPSAAHSLDRIDNNGNYCPENCRWATDEEQNNNRRNTRKVPFRGETRSVAQWCRAIGVSRRSFYRNTRAGLSDTEKLADLSK